MELIEETVKASNPREAKIFEAEKFIRNNFTQHLTLSTLCRQFGFSTSGFRRYWMAQFSISPGVFINQLRLERACTLLLETDKDLGRISREIGYNDSLYLSRKFKQQFGISPSYFRKKPTKNFKTMVRTSV